MPARLDRKEPTVWQIARSNGSKGANRLAKCQIGWIESSQPSGKMPDRLERKEPTVWQNARSIGYNRASPVGGSKGCQCGGLFRSLRGDAAMSAFQNVHRSYGCHLTSEGSQIKAVN
ncbi:hypothetical protein V3C99_017179 [Haemonchus contortus]